MPSPSALRNANHIWIIYITCFIGSLLFLIWIFRKLSVDRRSDEQNRGMRACSTFVAEPGLAGLMPTSIGSLLSYLWPSRTRDPSPPSKPTRSRSPAPEEAESLRPASVRSPKPVKQRYDAFLVLDVEATCVSGAGLDWPNEIIEWPVCLMRWKHTLLEDGRMTSRLEAVDEFRSFVRPTWRPILSDFCKGLTGITQEEVNNAPSFKELLPLFEEFLAKNGLIDPESGKRLQRFCCDTPYDICNFVVKQCFISKIPIPEWIKGDLLDVRRTVRIMMKELQQELSSQPFPQNPYVEPLSMRSPCAPPASSASGKRPSMNIPAQLQCLGLPEFVGRHHSGIDDARNIARILVDLARRDIPLVTNTSVNTRRRWPWMGKSGQIIEERYLS